MYVKVKTKGKVYYDFEQKVAIDDKRIYEVKSTGLVRELIKTNDLVETEKPTEAQLKKYAVEDKEAAERKAKPAVSKNKNVETGLKVAKEAIASLEDELSKVEGELVEANENLVKANLEIAALKEAAEKAGDSKSTLAEDKAKATSDKKEDTKAKNSEKA